jgi:TRAP-type C4-dicarboxylate transport system substrate-binding protein
MKRLPALLTLAALVFAPALSQAQTVLTTSMFVPKTHPMMQGVIKWCDEVAAATEKRVTCNILPKPVAGPAATFDAVRDGQADLATSIHGYTPGRFVLTSVAEFPLLGDSAEINSVAYQRVYERHLAKLNEHKGLKVVTVFTHGPGDIYLSKRPIKTAADLDGLKFRVGGGMVNDVAKALGANVLLKPATESYELLSSGVVDGVFFPAESVVVHRLENFVKYRTKVPGGLYNTSFAMVMNEAAWGRIAPADQAAITKLSGEHAARLIGREWDIADRRGAAAMDAKKIDSSPSPKAFVEEVRQKIAPLEQQWVEAAKERGLANAAQVLQEFRAEIAKEQR